MQLTKKHLATTLTFEKDNSNINLLTQLENKYSKILLTDEYNEKANFFFAYKNYIENNYENSIVFLNKIQKKENFFEISILKIWCSIKANDIETTLEFFNKIGLDKENINIFKNSINSTVFPTYKNFTKNEENELTVIESIMHRYFVECFKTEIIEMLKRNNLMYENYEKMFSIDNISKEYLFELYETLLPIHYEKNNYYLVIIINNILFKTLSSFINKDTKTNYLMVLGEAYNKVGKTNESLMAYKNAYRISPNNFKNIQGSKYLKKI